MSLVPGVSPAFGRQVNGDSSDLWFCHERGTAFLLVMGRPGVGAGCAGCWATALANELPGGAGDWRLEMLRLSLALREVAGYRALTQDGCAGMSTARGRADWTPLAVSVD